jgi:hypothetical protein
MSFVGRLDADHGMQGEAKRGDCAQLASRPKPAGYSYDERCEELAEYFLQDQIIDGRPVLTEHNKKDLAQAIQDAVENWMEGIS